nr:hypothetical protein CFP56_34835 [Quercus suber]
MLPPGLKSPHEVFQYYEAVYDKLIDSGEALPFTYPGLSVGVAVVLGYLLIDHRRSSWLKALRYPVFAFFCAFQLWCVLTNRARNIGAGFGIGIMSAFGCLYVFTIMIASDCQTDFQRIERVNTVGAEQRKASENSSAAGNQALEPPPGTALRQRQQPMELEQASAPESPASLNGSLYWQSYPADSFLRRLDWVSDLFFSFRGIGWNWQISGIPPPPSWVETSLKTGTNAKITEKIEPRTTSRTGIRRYSDRTALLKDAIASVIICYIVLDVVKALMRHDPHFWGYINCPGPSHLPAMMRDSPVLLQSYRLLTQLIGVYAALRLIFALGPILMSGLLGPDLYGIRGEPWMNPANMFGSFNFVGERGLAGWWGGWWHQVFRSVFEPPATLVLKKCNIDRRSMLGKSISGLVAFFLSGFLHTSGSYTQLGDTRPLKGPMVFFLLQFAGIMAEDWVKSQIKRTGISHRVPNAIKQLLNYILAIVWMYHTAPYLVDDFARGGIWLYEPVPLSPLIALGYGIKGDTVWCWHGIVRWRNGKGWYDTGITL